MKCVFSHYLHFGFSGLLFLSQDLKNLALERTIPKSSSTKFLSAMHNANVEKRLRMG